MALLLQNSDGNFLTRLGAAPRWVLLGVMVGVVSGLGAAGFFYSLEWVTHFAFDTLAHAPMTAPAGEELIHPTHSGENPIKWIFFILPVIGGIISGILVYTWAPEAEGHGTDAMIDSFHNKRGVIRGRVPFIKSLATIATLGLGGSAGREGPIAQIGAGFGSWLATKFGLSAKDRRIMLLAGTAGGLGAIFRSPLGGAITAIEVLYSEDFESEAMIPCIISSVTGYAIFASIFGYGKIFEIPGFSWTNPVELFFYIALGLLCVPVGKFYVWFFYMNRDKIFRKIRIPQFILSIFSKKKAGSKEPANKFPRFLIPAIGGVGVGLVGLLVPESYGSGWGTIQQALSGTGQFSQVGYAAMFSMLIIIGAKILTTSFTIGSGGSGGVFGPTLFIGGMLGGLVGMSVEMLFPGLLPNHATFVLVGMGGFFAGVANAPIGALLMCCEMTGGYDLLVPLLLVSGIAILFSRKWSIYEKQVKDKFSSPAHLGDLTIDVLENMSVKDAYITDEGMEILPNNMRFGDFRKHLIESTESFFPIKDYQGKITGIVTVKDSRQGIFEQGLDDLVVLSDIAMPFVSVCPGDNLRDTLVKILKTNTMAFPVVDEDDPNKIIGVLRHEDLIGAYHKQVLILKKDGEVEWDIFSKLFYFLDRLFACPENLLVKSVLFF